MKVIESLRATKVAHGDLQHGNLIIQNSQFRLIDLDGMFVPSMQGWNSSEIGHPHYQHPERSFRDFNLGLDNFSALVIYLSLLALAEAPELWHEFHDENLIFTKSDFVDPNSSRLFSRLRKMGQQQQDLGQTLMRAARAKPGDAPYLLDLATRKSKLPAWMTAPADVRIEVKTREASAQAVSTSSQTAGTQSTYPPLWKPTAITSVGQPQVPQSAQPQTAPTAQQPTLRRPSLDWKRVHSQAWPKALQIGFVGLFFFWLWLPILQGVAEGFGIAKADSSAFVFWSYVLGCLLASYIFTLRKEWPKAATSAPTGTFSQPTPWTPPPRAPWTKPSRGSYGSTTRPAAKTSGSAVYQVVGSKIRFIYHRPNCEWAMKMSYRNRITFTSPAAASSSGYRACKVCRP
ncbi:MAG: Ada metal-binding domain-containing protein [Terriglobales bacterium]